MRRARELIADHVSDLGGLENTSAAERSIVRRASTLTIECERFEATFAKLGENELADPDVLDQYRKCCDSLRRLLETIGLRRRAREVAVLPPPTTDHGRARASALRGRLVEIEGEADDG